MLALIGLVLAVAGSLAATVLKPDNHVTAGTPEDTAPYLMTHAGVLDLLDPPVTVTATGEPNTEITMVVGRAGDIQAWLEGAEYREIVGLETWSVLKTVEHAAAQPPATPGPAGQSDMWLQTKTGTGKVSLTLDKDEANTSILVTTDGQSPAPSLSITWEQPTSLGWAFSLIAVGILLIVLGLTVWVHLRREPKQKKLRKRDLQRQRRREDTARTIETTVGGRTRTLPSRRAMREARERGEQTLTVGGQTFDTGLIPVVKQVREDPEAPLQKPRSSQENDDPTVGDKENES